MVISNRGVIELYLIDRCDLVSEGDSDVILERGQIIGVTADLGNDAALDALGGHAGEEEVAAGMGRQVAQTGTVDGFPVGVIKIVLVHFQQLLSAAIHHPLDQGFDLLMNGDFPVGACFGFDAADHIAFVQVDIFKEDG